MSELLNLQKKTIHRDHKLRFKKEFEYLRQFGQKQVGKRLVMAYVKSPDQKLRLGVICGKKFHKRAVKRNRARRLIWESLRLMMPLLHPAVHVIFIPRQAIMECRRQEVEKEIIVLLSRAGLNQQS